MRIDSSQRVPPLFTPASAFYLGLRAEEHISWVLSWVGQTFGQTETFEAFPKNLLRGWYIILALLSLVFLPVATILDLKLHVFVFNSFKLTVER